MSLSLLNESEDGSSSSELDPGSSAGKFSWLKWFSKRFWYRLTNEVCLCRFLTVTLLNKLCIIFTVLRVWFTRNLFRSWVALLKLSDPSSGKNSVTISCGVSLKEKCPSMTLYIKRQSFYAVAFSSIWSFPSSVRWSTISYFYSCNSSCSFIFTVRNLRN